MVAFVAGAVLTAANLNASLNQLTIRTVTGTSDTLLLADQGGAVSYSNAASTTSTIPPNSSVAFATGTKIVLINLGAGVVTVTAGAGVTVNGATLTLAQNAGGTCIKTATNTWSFLPFSSGSAPAVISSTTGSPTITTDGTATIYKFTGDGTLVVGTAGIATVLTVGSGGGGGRGGGGGGGGSVLKNIVNLTAQTYTVKVAAGGAGATTAYVSGFEALPSFMSGTDALLASPSGGGGGGATSNVVTTLGGSSGGGGTAASSFTPPTASNTAIGFTGGVGVSGGNACGGGGGAGAVGTAGVSTTGGNGGAGASDSITGTAVLYGMGGGGGATGTAGTAPTNGGAGAIGTANASNGAANFGGGGGGSAGGATGNGGTGGSGVVIVRVG